MGINLRQTLCEITKQLEHVSDYRLRSNLIAWQRKFAKKINDIEEPNIRNLFNDKNCITEAFLEDYIYKMGFFIEGMSLIIFERQVKTAIGVIDLIGITDKNKYIIELKSTPAKSYVIGQTIAYWQYLKETENKDYPIIIIAPSYTRQYYYALKAIKDIRISSYRYKVSGEGIKFTSIDKMAKII